MTSFQAVMLHYPLVLPLAAGLLGLIVGSFLNVVILRLPVMLERKWRRQCAEMVSAPLESKETERFDLLLPRSRCPHCGHQIKALENIPVISFLWLGGKCRECGKAISWRYPAVELASALASAIVAWQFGWQWQTVAALGFTWTLIALTVIDYDHHLLPDDITLPLLWAGLLINLLVPIASASSAIVGAAAGYLSLWLVFHVFKWLTGKEGMGYGDFKLFAAFGAWLGWQQLPFVILFASFSGALVGIAAIIALGRDRRLPIPFGPFLCVAGWVALLWGEQITRAYLQFARLG